MGLEFDAEIKTDTINFERVDPQTDFDEGLNGSCLRQLSEAWNTKSK
jgi:hypothetical protein